MLIKNNPMRLFIKHIAVLPLMLILWQFEVQAQVNIYPLELTTQLVPPYSSRIVDYAAPQNEKLRLVVIQRDLTQPSYRFFLRMELSVNGKVLFRTSSNWFPNSTTITPGVPTIFGGTDLQQYFDINHLEFVNYSAQQYLSNPNLPEGFATICFTAYDAGRPDVAVSLSGCGNYYLTLPQPPVLNYPACGTQVTGLQPQQMIFSWTPMNMGNLASATTLFNFSLYENRDNRNPNDVVQTVAPIYTLQTAAPTIVYGAGEPALQDSMNYVWRVQAFDRLGNQSFVNNGFSQPCSFSYIPMNVQLWSQVNPLQVSAQGMNEATGKASWLADAALLYDSYAVDYRKAGNSAYGWFSDITTDTVLFIKQLEASTRYEVKVRGIKGIDTSNYSNTAVFSTSEKQIYSCAENAPQSILQPYNGRPYTSAIKGDIVHYGNFEVTLNQIQQGQDGLYSGNFTLLVPFMANKQMKAHFTNLQIDDAMQVTAGEIDFDSEGINDWANDTTIKTATQLAKDISNFAKILNHLLELNDTVQYLQAVDSFKTVIFNQFAPANLDDATNELLSKKFDELKDIANNAPLNTQENKDSANNKLHDIEQLVSNNSKNHNNVASNNTSSNKQSFYLIEGNKFYNGDTIFIPKSNKVYNIKGYKDSVTLVNASSVWTGFNNKTDSATYTYVPATASRSIVGSVLQTSFTRDSIYRDTVIKVNDTLTCRIVVVDGNFKENQNQSFGFDENIFPKYEQYDSFSNKPITWKSLQAGSPDKAYASTQPIRLSNKIEYYKNNTDIIIYTRFHYKHTSNNQCRL
jgi:hypothetical protein